MAKCVDSSKSVRLGARLLGHHRTKGGSMDTEVKEFAVMPTFRPSGETVVTTVTPVAYWPNALRKSRTSKTAESSSLRACMKSAAAVGSNHHG